jgi:PHD/YefM family antitoxin component YafN of YafNO toxin-antitoxin module
MAMTDKPMLVTIQANSVPALDPLIGAVGLENKHLVIEKDGQRVAAMISIAEYDALMKEREANEQAKTNRLKRFEHLAREMGEALERRGVTEEQALQDLDKTRQRIFEETYGRKSNPTNA